MASNFLLLATIMLALTSMCLAADPVSTAKAAAQKAQAATQVALNVAKSVDNGPNKGKADTCIEVIGDAIDNLSECIKLLNGPINGEVKSDIQTKGSAALTDVGTCDDEFGSSQPPKLKQASANSQKLISSFLAIVNQLN